MGVTFDPERLRQYSDYKNSTFVETPLSIWGLPLHSEMPEYQDLSDVIANAVQGVVPLPSQGVGNLRATNDIGPPLGKPKSSGIVGNPDLVQRHGLCFMKPARGWKFNPRLYRIARNQYSPIEILLGDCISKDNLTDVVPGWLKAGNHTHMGELAKMYYNSFQYNSGANATQRSLSRAMSLVRFWNTQGNGYYTDLCLPVFRTDSVGTFDWKGTGVSTDPINIEDIFKRPSGEYLPLHMFATGAYALKHQNTNQDQEFPYLGGDPNFNYMDHAFVSIQTDVRLTNTTKQTQTYELYLCEPKAVTEMSPMADMDICIQDNMEQNPTYDYSTASAYMVGSDPSKFQVWRKKWRYKKKVITVVSGSTISVRMRIPLSLIRNEVVRKLRGTLDNSASIPGLTQWLWIRAYGTYGYDTEFHSAGYGRGIIGAQMYQKVRVLYSQPHITKRINIMRVADLITPDELVAQDDTTAVT